MSGAIPPIHLRGVVPSLSTGTTLPLPLLGIVRDVEADRIAELVTEARNACRIFGGSY
jgi:hypothetical protein